MRILVSFKVTPDYEALPETSWSEAAGKRSAGSPGMTAGGAGEEQDALRELTRYVRRVLNCFDESALELALRLREALEARGEAGELAALSVGGRDAEPYFKTLLALGYERATIVTLEGEAGGEAESEAAADGFSLDFAPAATAALIAAFARQVDHSDLLLLGCRSGPGDSGIVPFLVAEALGWPCLSQVVGVEPAGGGRLRVTMTADGGLLRATVRTPCVLAIGNAVVSRLRVPALKDRLALGKRGADVMRAGELGVWPADPERAVGEQRGPGGALIGLEAIDRSRGGVVLTGNTPRDKAQALFDGYLKARLQTLRRGSGQP